MFPLRDVRADEIAADAGRRDRNKLRTRSQLNAAALRLFATHGYEETSVDDIAAEAGVSVRTFFRYFASKEDVLFAQEMDLTAFLDRVAQQPRGVSPIAAIRQAYHEQPPLTDEEIKAQREFHEGMATSSVLLGHYFEGMHEFRTELADVLARRAGRKQATEADILAATIGQTTLDYAYMRWNARGARGDFRKAVDAAFELLERVTIAE